MKILIIEDEYSLADAIAETLKKENFTTNIITDGEEGENEAEESSAENGFQPLETDGLKHMVTDNNN